MPCHVIPNSTHCHGFSHRRLLKTQFAQLSHDDLQRLRLQPVGSDCGGAEENANHPDLRMTANDGVVAGETLARGRFSKISQNGVIQNRNSLPNVGLVKQYVSFARAPLSTHGETQHGDVPVDVGFVLLGASHQHCQAVLG